MANTSPRQAMSTKERAGTPSARRRWPTAAAVMTFAPLSAAACTLCHSDVARDVRQRVFGPEFVATAAAVVAPLPVLLAGIFLAGREARPGKDSR